jgi:uncharacterized protein with FMN-binding domain
MTVFQGSGIRIRRRESCRYQMGATWFLCAGIIAILAQGPIWGESTQRVVRSSEEVEALIQKAGSEAPDWWDTVPLKYPDTLDLDWPIRTDEGWNNQKNVGQYLWDVINPNPVRWKEGIKLVHHVMLRDNDDRAKMARSMECLGTMFHNFTQDWPRAVFWWRMSAKYGQPTDPAMLANCFWQMGCKEKAQEILQRLTIDYTRNGAIIKLWADMGEMDKALRLVEPMARGGRPNIAYLAAGNACRQAGRMAEALTYYRKATEATPPDPKNGDFTRAQAQANENIAVIRTFEMLDLKLTADGRYTATSTAFAGPLMVDVVVKAGRIASVQVTQHSEKQFYSAMTETPNKIVERQSVKDIDACTGATITSEAIINATAKALAQWDGGGKNP